MIDIKKKYRCKASNNVRIVFVNDRHAFGYVDNVAYIWGVLGGCITCGFDIDDLDLIEVKPYENIEIDTPVWVRGGSMGEVIHEGMTLRQYAAIKLKVPNSGTAWLDEMIRESLRNELEARAMAAIIAHPGGPAGRWEQCALDAHEVADAVLKARAGK